MLLYGAKLWPTRVTMLKRLELESITSCTTGGEQFLICSGKTVLQTVNVWNLDTAGQ